MSFSGHNKEEKIFTPIEELNRIKEQLDLNNPQDVSQWVQKLRDEELPRSAEKVLVNYLAEEKPATKALGWPRDDYSLDKKKTLQPDQPTMLIPREGRKLSDLSITPDLSQYIIPKFRGIHYRQESSSRFSKKKNYRDHVNNSQLDEDTLSASVYKNSKINTYDSRRRVTLEAQKKFSQHYKDYQSLKSTIRLENKIRKTFSIDPIDINTIQSFDELQFVLPDLADDFVDQIVQKRSQLPTPNLKKFKQSQPENQNNSLLFEEQMYVNTMEKYKTFQEEETGDMGMFQVSLTDNPAHGGKYGFGEKFTTPRQNRFKQFTALKKKKLKKRKPESKKRKRNNYAEMAENFLQQDTPLDDPSIVRKIKGTVGKLYTYMMPPEELYESPVRKKRKLYHEESDEPAFNDIKPITTMTARRNKQISLKPNQARELETTFFTKIPKQFLVHEKKLHVPKKDRNKYQKVSFTPTGSSMRERFSQSLVEPTWEKAHELAQQKRKILIPHGTFDTIYGNYMKNRKE